MTIESLPHEVTTQRERPVVFLAGDDVQAERLLVALSGTGAIRDSQELPSLSMTVVLATSFPADGPTLAIPASTHDLNDADPLFEYRVIDPRSP
jgi:hypothetical protein